MITTIKGFKESVDTVKKLIEEQRRIALIIRPEDAKWQETLNNQIDKLDSNEFRVLVMGVFSAGKSAFLNAILGQNILPAKLLPTTSVITEVRYGTEKKVIVYPKPGRWDGGDEPFEIEPSNKEIARYGTINNKVGINVRKKNDEGVERLESPFSKIEIIWPLPILEGGIVMIDSPGLDDPYCHDDIVHDYMPSASAIIYLENTTGQRGVDARELLMLNNLSYQPIICVTHFDEACKTFSSDDDREEYIEANIANNSRFTNLGRKGIFFLSSLDGLKAKLTNDDQLLQESGYKDLEKFLELYLIENRAAAHLDSVAGKMRTMNQEMKSAAEGIVSDGDKDNETLKIRVEIAETKLEELRVQKISILEDFKRQLANIDTYVREEAGKYIDKLSELLTMDGFEAQTVIPSGTDRLLHPMKVNKAAKSLADEAAVFLRQECEAKTGTWYKDELMPGAYKYVQEAAREMGKSFETYQKDISDLSGILKEPENGKDGKVFGCSVGEILAGFGAGWIPGLLTPVYGPGTGTRFLCANLLANVLMVVFPVSWPMAISGLLCSYVIALITGEDSQTRRIKKDALKGVKEFYNKPENRNQFVEDIAEQTKKVIDGLSDSLEKAFSDDISVVEREIEDKRNSALISSEQRTQEKMKMEEAMEGIDKLNEEITKIVSQYEIA